MKIGILISGRGSNMVSIAEAVSSGSIPDSEVAVVISNKSSARGLESASEMGIPSFAVERCGRSREEHDREIVGILNKHGVEVVCLAGYMRLLSPYFVQSFPNRILNIHPSLLPSFPGTDAVKQALDYGVRVTGCTVHFVDEELDHGPVIEQIPVEVFDGDNEETLSARILDVEHSAYISALKKLVSKRLEIVGRSVKVLQ